MVLKPETRLTWGVHIASLLPALWLFVQWQTANLGANPVQAITRQTGRIAVIWLLLTLACTPASLFGWDWPRRQRRALGLYTFFYSLLHFLTFAVLDYGLQIGIIFKTLIQQTFILPGLAGLLILTVLALTSHKKAIQRLHRYWKPIQRTVYLAGVLILLNAAWAIKIDRRLVVVFSAIFFLLMLFRIPPVQKWLRARKPNHPSTQTDG